MCDNNGNKNPLPRKGVTERRNENQKTTTQKKKERKKKKIRETR